MTYTFNTGHAYFFAFLGIGVNNHFKNVVYQISFTFCGPCNMIYLRNKYKPDATLFLNVFQ